MPGSSSQAKALSLGFMISKSKKGTMETRIKTCRECGLELCTGAWCKLCHYEFYTRAVLDKEELEAEEKGTLKGIIAQANAKPDKKGDRAKVKKRRDAKKGPSLKALITSHKLKGKKKKKKKKDKKEEEN
jgi:hypothetical protein